MRIRRLLHFAMTLMCAAALWSTAAQAAVTCSVIPSGFTSVYDPALATPTDNASSVTVTCMRGAANDPTTIYFGLAADNGLNPAAPNNQASSGANRLAYEVYQDAARTKRWGLSTTRDIEGVFTLSGFTPSSMTLPYYSRIPAGQLVPTGNYSDSVQLTLRYGTQKNNLNQTAPGGSFPVLILVNPTCQFSTPPGSIAFAYTSFQASAANASTPFAALCTSGLPYTMSLDTTSGTLLGIAYTLALSASASTGTGAAQAFSVNGSIAGGQAGTCATGTCSASNVHTLTITY